MISTLARFALERAREDVPNDEDGDDVDAMRDVWGKCLVVDDGGALSRLLARGGAEDGGRGRDACVEEVEARGDREDGEDTIDR